MSRFKIGDLSTLEKSPTSPLTLRNKIGEMLFNSTQAVATVEIVNKETGEYRVVLQGTLDTEESRFEER
ncbi:MAG: hypothetical protein L0191_11605 [Acidobacteria bacterium]|nr:hypothetical protein [Acidobacteriota bacterium]MCI0568548.1 hypothetical protein [Acidobacteriota bacterium]